MKFLRKLLFCLVAAAATLAVTSAIVLPLLPLKDVGACLGFLFWLVPPFAALALAAKRWDANEARRLSAEIEASSKARAAEEREAQARFYAKQQAEREAKWKKLRQEQLLTEAGLLRDGSIACWRQLPELAQQAASALEKAEKEFAERVYVPFWEAIGIAMKALAMFNGNVEYINTNRQRYRLILSELEQKPRPFVISSDLIPDPRPVADRLAKIVREAHKDDQFALVFGQWRTNEILLTGFASLQQAIWGMSDRLDASISDLKWSVSNKLSQVAEAQREDARSGREAGERRSEIMFALMGEAVESMDEHRRDEVRLLEEIRDQTRRRDV